MPILSSMLINNEHHRSSNMDHLHLANSHIRRLCGLDFGLGICRSSNNIVNQVAFEKIQNYSTQGYV
jgi:hypothetical protein